MTNAFANILIEGNCVAEASAAGMGCCRQKAIIGRVPAVHIGMGNTGEHSEIIAKILQHLQIWRERIIAAALFWEELLRQQSEIVADTKHTTRLSTRSGVGTQASFSDSSKCRRHGIGR